MLFVSFVKRFLIESLKEKKSFLTTTKMLSQEIMEISLRLT